MAYNKVILVGRIVADPELKQTQNGVAVTNFTLAVDRQYSRGDEKQTDFPTIIAWRSLAEFICKYFKKGSAILIEGELQTRSWTDGQGNKRFATEVVAAEARFCEPKKNSETNSVAQINAAAQGKFEASAGYTTASHSQPSFEELVPDESLPF